jgi:DNA polymerase elongation subunit (family B)
MYTFVRKYGNQIFVRETGNKIKRISKYPFNVYFEKGGGSYKSIEGTDLDVITFPTLKEANKYVNNAVHQKSMSLYGAKNFGYYYIRDKYHGLPAASVSDLYIANIDIETGRDEQGYSTAKEARCPITAITLENVCKKTFIAWGWGKNKWNKKDSVLDQNIDVRYQHFNTEAEMLFDYISYMSTYYPDIITGWNSNQYDIPYIINRTHILFNDAQQLIDGMSPFGRVHDREIKDDWGNYHIQYDIVGISLLDYLDLFKKFVFKTPDNYKLDTVAHLILGDSKLSYGEYKNLQDLRDNNYQKFIDYNIKDVLIVHRLDDKLKLFDLVLSVAYKAGINYTDVVSPVTTWDILIYNVLMDDNIVPPINMKENYGGRYVGAYVKEPVPGKYKWVISCDLNSLYPHLQMGYNISPEKRLTDDQLPDELYDIRNQLGGAVNGIQKLLNERIDTSILKEYGVCVTPNGQFYRTDSDGFIPVILEGLYKERKAVKKSMLEDKQKMEDDSSNDLENQIAAKNTLQMALKILMNSEYGAMANQYFRYFDLKNAEAITSSGQLAILWVAKHLNIFLNKVIGTDDKDYIIAIDTDSVYLNLEELVNKFIKSDCGTEKIVDILDGWAQKVLEPEINRIYENLAKYTNAHKQKMVMAREVIADTGFWTGKKRYALNVHDSEGVRFTKPHAKIMGLECVRSSTPEIVRNMIKDSIKIILRKDEQSFQDYISKAETTFFNSSYDDVSFPRGVNNIEKWESDGVPKKGCPIHVRGAIVYNKFIKDNNLVDSEEIQSGDKIKFCYLKLPNNFKSPVISYPPGLPEEVHDEIEQYIDYNKQWEGTFLKPIKMYAENVGWKPEKVYTVFD